MRKAGRFTSALLLIAVGTAVIFDQYAHTDWTGWLIQWWPLLFIALGLEYIWFNSRYGESDKPLKLDLGGLLFTVLISAIVIASMHADLWMKNGWSNFAHGKSFDKGTTTFQVPNNIDRIELMNQVGNVTVRTGSADRIEVQTTVYVRGQDEANAQAIAEQSRLESSTNGSTLTIRTTTPEEGMLWGMGKARMDLVVLMPQQAQQASQLTLNLSNGSITAEQMRLSKGFKGTTTNGAIRLTRVEAADLDFQSTNAKISASGTKGKLKLQTTNGSIEADGHDGDIRMKSTNGQITAAGISGAIVAETTNGGIHLDGVKSAVQARTTNGSLEVGGTTINGDWSLQTTHGKIDAALPASGDFQVYGKGQSVSNSSSLPLRIDGKELRGTMGSGKYHINMDTNGSLLVRMAS